MAPRLPIQSTATNNNRTTTNNKNNETIEKSKKYKKKKAVVEINSLNNEVQQIQESNSGNNSNVMNDMNMTSYNSMGMGGMGGMGMMSPYYNNMHMGGGMMGMGMGGMGNSPLNNITNMLFSAQQAIFSLSQVVQIVGMNSNALSQMITSTLQLFDSAYQTIVDLHKLHRNATNKEQTEEEKKKIRRLKALRWSLVLALSYTMYKSLHTFIQWLRFRHRRRNVIGTDTHLTQPNLNSNPQLQPMMNNSYYPQASYNSPSYYM